ncbi:hypothetical protein BBK36DRAFT_1144006 [Trichoderma citrinoviride]|uniref:Uncharacterized protein n=1 Tax=Trichoderma citrinoviride TaxID=58853 RepID=A0A2T4B2I7_9HYPO|nr:hypothetical protein BBK36DRAFT_1144006 [Trichoderma citrinoviride]PTB63537.1 hypothetical protein BBK36DRAFT_1144006 [Trichoderma citrinoviride]
MPGMKQGTPQIAGSLQYLPVYVALQQPSGASSSHLTSHWPMRTHRQHVRRDQACGIIEGSSAAVRDHVDFVDSMRARLVHHLLSPAIAMIGSEIIRLVRYPKSLVKRGATRCSAIMITIQTWPCNLSQTPKRGKSSGTGGVACCASASFDAIIMATYRAMTPHSAMGVKGVVSCCRCMIFKAPLDVNLYQKAQIVLPYSSLVDRQTRENSGFWGPNGSAVDGVASAFQGSATRDPTGTLCRIEKQHRRVVKGTFSRREGGHELHQFSPCALDTWVVVETEKQPEARPVGVVLHCVRPRLVCEPSEDTAYPSPPRSTRDLVSPLFEKQTLPGLRCSTEQHSTCSTAAGAVAACATGASEMASPERNAARAVSELMRAEKSAMSRRPEIEDGRRHAQRP